MSKIYCMYYGAIGYGVLDSDISEQDQWKAWRKDKVDHFLTFAQNHEGDYVQFIILPVQLKSFKKFMFDTGWPKEQCVFEKGPIKNLRYPELPPRLYLFLYRIPQTGVSA